MSTPVERIAGILVVVALVSLTAAAAISPEAVEAGFGAAYSLFHDLAASAIQKS